MLNSGKESNAMNGTVEAVKSCVIYRVAITH